MTHDQDDYASHEAKGNASTPDVARRTHDARVQLERERRGRDDNNDVTGKSLGPAYGVQSERFFLYGDEGEN